jgi:signal transduction histidine kinase
MLGRLELMIRDDGMGIAEQDLANPSFFLPGRKRNTTKQHSTGYGLAIALRNLAAHGGTLKLESRPNEGMTVRIVLPLRQTDEGPVS